MSTPQSIAKARRIHNAQHAKAVEIAPLAEQVCRIANAPAAHLLALPDDAWLQMAQAVGKAGKDGTNVPSDTTRAMVIDLVEAALKRTQHAV
jgi:hypothetical protein